MHVQTHVIHTHTCISFNTTVVVGVSETLNFCLNFKGERACQGSEHPSLPLK